MSTIEQPIVLDPVLLTVEDAARALALGRTTVYQLLADGSLRSVKIGRARRVPRDALRDYVNTVAAEQTGPRQ